MKYFSMFSGIGGFEKALEDAYGKKNDRSQEDTQEANEARQGLESSTSKELGTQGGQSSQCVNNIGKGCQQATCIGFSEIDKYAIKCYQSHFPDHKNHGDATKLIPEQLPDFQLLVGGFPCQAFSIAGKREGFNDTRGTLFFEIARILKHKRPRHFILENVKGLLSHDSGKTFNTILGVLSDLGYRVEWQVLNSKYHGVPQNRERVFFIGHLRGECARKAFPIGECDTKNESESGVESNGKSWISTLDSRYGQRWSTETYVRADIKDKQPERNKPDNSNSIRREAHPINRIRRLTPTECERLQGFPDGWTSMLSDLQRYKCLGNAVTVNVIRDIIERFECLNARKG